MRRFQSSASALAFGLSTLFWTVGASASTAGDSASSSAAPVGFAGNHWGDHGHWDNHGHGQPNSGWHNNGGHGPSHNPPPSSGGGNNDTDGTGLCPPGTTLSTVGGQDICFPNN